MNSGMSISEKTKPWGAAMTGTSRAGTPPAKSILAAAAARVRTAAVSAHTQYFSQWASETRGPLIRRIVVEHFLPINA